MRVVIILCMFVAFTFAKPLHDQQEGPITTNLVFNNNGLGLYNYAYDTSDGVHREESSSFSNPNDPESSLVVKGSYSYFGPDGVKYEVHYIADENGYRIIKDTPINKSKF